MGYPTPQTLPAAVICRRLFIPDDPIFIAAVNGALLDLCDSNRWEHYGAVTPVEAASAALVMYEEYFETDACMIGSIVPYASAEPPGGVLPCDGSIYLRENYPRLYAALDPAFIVDADQFRTPDLRGRFVFGVDSVREPGQTGGEETHTLSESEMPAHTHTNAPHTHSEIAAVAAFINGGIEAPAAAATPAATVTGASSVVIDATGGGQPHNNMPPYMALKWGIVAR